LHEGSRKEEQNLEAHKYRQTALHDLRRLVQRSGLHQVPLLADQIIAEENIHLIVDNLRVHLAKHMNAWGAQRRRKSNGTTCHVRAPTLTLTDI
jgi:hypothetical protein